jgi:hypothetical protein
MPISASVANADNFRLIVAGPTWGATDASTATCPDRPAGGNASQATYSPMSSSRTSRQSRPLWSLEFRSYAAAAAQARA